MRLFRPPGNKLSYDITESVTDLQKSCDQKEALNTQDTGINAGPELFVGYLYQQIASCTYETKTDYINDIPLEQHHSKIIQSQLCLENMTPPCLCVA